MVQKLMHRRIRNTIAGLVISGSALPAGVPQPLPDGQSGVISYASLLPSGRVPQDFLSKINEFTGKNDYVRKARYASINDDSSVFSTITELSTASFALFPKAQQPHLLAIVVTKEVQGYDKNQSFYRIVKDFDGKNGSVLIISEAASRAPISEVRFALAHEWGHALINANRNNMESVMGTDHALDSVITAYRKDIEQMLTHARLNKEDAEKVRNGLDNTHSEELAADYIAIKLTCARKGGIKFVNDHIPQSEHEMKNILQSVITSFHQRPPKGKRMPDNILGSLTHPPAEIRAQAMNAASTACSDERPPYTARLSETSGTRSYGR